MIEVDVLVRTNGEGLYLREALDSVLGQTMLPLIKCHVSVFNPSLGLIETLRDYTSNPIFCFHWISQEGYAHPLNEMIACAKSEFVALLDHDDVMNERRIEIQLDYMKHNPEIGALGSAINLIDANSRVIGEKYYSKSPEHISKIILRATPIANPSCMIRSELISTIGGYRSFYDTAEDYDLWLRLSEMTLLCNLSDKLTSYRIHQNQITSTARFRNLSASKSALQSRKCRSAGKKEVHESWHSAIEWASQPHIKFQISYEIAQEWIIRKSVQTWREGRLVATLGLLLIIGFMNPIKGLRLIATKVR